ncbi:rhodanese-like domain-containing protein [Clostridium thermobutyricum]|uniref:Molybdopterin biosynthesis protein MoeB n=1 Tax=Clostridium thermobutyricum DSM 4928 TaxID=1121339 RepID=A0A1V4SU29_9CLOT|nr:rhodanese-like domain-containing protein [Clostridium thermobutyricum]OPX47371.1 molybdopterin biosynthesis protein MoeB [Clostridium thermobutyricum DSM 4928]
MSENKNELKKININEIDKLIGSINIIDIRDEDEIALFGTIDTVKHVPMNKILECPEMFISKDKTYYILCHSGNRSGRVCAELNPLGYDLINIEGGFARYRGENRIDMY